MRQNMIRWTRPAMFAAVGLVLLSCDENLPSGPDTFPARLEIGVTSDTIVVGDSSKAQARAIGPNGGLISGLTFNWTTSSSATLGLASSDSANARTRTLVGVKAGQSALILTLPDERFVTTSATRNETVVVGGVKVLSSRDTTLSAINDTARAIATSLVKSNGALVNRVSQGIRWVHLGTRTTVVGTGDTIRYIARANGADTLIATHDFCLKSAKCADTVIARVTQVLTLSLSTHALQVWSFADSVAPTVIVADRRGTGLAGTFARFIPIGAADSTIVTVTPVLGTTNPTTGVIATPRLVSIANGAARVIVRAVAPDGTIIGSDTVSETVRQVARRIMVEPLSASLSVIDFIPYVSRARDARGAVIEDATTGVTSNGTAISATQIGPNATNTPASVATITPTLTGIALPENNPGAPQLPVIVLSSSVSLLPVDTVKAGATGHQISVSVFDSTGAPAAGAVVRFSVSHGIPPAAVISDGSGVAQVTWFTQDSTGSYTLTGVLDRPNALTTADTAGTTVIRRSAVVQAGPANASKSTVSASPTTIAVTTTSTITVTVNDFFNNPVLTTVPGDLSVTATVGTVGAGSCANGVCTYTYTAPAASGSATITAKLGTQSVANSPLTITITP
jgi:hypothetical protein